MKTFKQLRAEQLVEEYQNLVEYFDSLSKEEILDLYENDILTEEEIIDIENILREYSLKQLGSDITDTAGGFAKGLLGAERFKKYGGKARSYFTGKSPEEEERKIEKAQKEREQRSPKLFGAGKTVGKYVPAVVGGIVGSRIGGKLGGKLPGVAGKVGKVAGGVVGGVTGSAAAQGAAELAKGDSDEKTKDNQTKPSTIQTDTQTSAPEAPKPADVPKPKTPEAPKPADAPKPSTDVTKKTLPSTTAPKPDDLEKAKQLIKKREASVSPIYKIGNVAGKMFGGSKEVQSGVSDTYSRLSKDPKAAAEFLRIQQQRNKEMGVK